MVEIMAKLDNGKSAFIILCLVLITVIIFLKDDSGSALSNGQLSNSEGLKVEVYHFHRTQQCYSCITLGRLAEETLNNSFRLELESGEIVFNHIDVEIESNAELVEKYGATGSSLWIGTYVNGTFYKEENTQLWYLLSKELEFYSYLSGIVEKRLNGDLS